MAGQHNINVGLNVQFNTENSKQLSQLNSTLAEANRSQIAANERIDKLLKEIGKSTGVVTTEIVKETRATRDATASMNAWSAANVKIKSVLYQNVGVLRNLGEMVSKTITVWVPWTRILTALEQTAEFLKKCKDALIDFAVEEARFKPTFLDKIKVPQKTINDIDKLNKALGFFWTFKQANDPENKPVEEQLKEAKNALGQLLTISNEAEANLPRLDSEIASAEKEVRRLQKALYDLVSQEGDPRALEKVFQLDLYSVAKNITQTIKQVIGEPEIQKELDKAVDHLYSKIQERQLLKIETEADFTTNAFRIALQEKIARLQKEVDAKGDGRNPKKKVEEYKTIYGDLSWFIEQWEESTLIKEKNWLTDLEKWRRDAYRRRDKDAKTQWEKQKSEWLIKETFINKYVENAKKQFEEVAKIQQGVQAKYGDYETKKGGAAYLESEAKKKAALLTRDYLDVDLKNTTEAEKKKIANMEKELTEALERTSDQAWNTLQQKLAEYQKVFDEQEDVLKRPDLNTDQQLRAWTIQNEMRDKSKEAWKEYYDFLSEHAEELGLKEKEIADERAKQWADQFRFIDKDKAYWKGTKKAMDAVIEATTELGASEKVVHAISNYAKGIEASVDAINIGADGLHLFAAGDIKGGIAMEAAALAKANAAAAYFKNAIQLGGKGGSAPNLSSMSYTGGGEKERNITINMAFEGTAGAIIGPLADAFNQQASVPGGVRLNSNVIRRR